MTTLLEPDVEAIDLTGLEFEIACEMKKPPCGNAATHMITVRCPCRATYAACPECIKLTHEVIAVFELHGIPLMCPVCQTNTASPHVDIVPIQ